ncbi:iron-sulfur protein [Anaerosporomusa subterranea]|jgi:putative NADPH-quinone reductase|uniref:Iron-sulfur protein n=1 Tax=Anaerosporomusa subterranea TaxID=1794912 RepID=A0A154BLK0_ANASB|nr:flavodoxin family protein [Anaerosporomusa subterranea]KYZ74796.1 iron-sulfur protein [Anaerosporomusa subterranea]MDF2502182.1 NADPH-dependent reductase [Anaerosporomusa subterranea]
MKIVLINGSPRGRSSNTQIMAESFLQGAQEAGANTLNVFLAEKEIRYCHGCFSCWLKTPGRCVIADDMKQILAEADGADVLVLASPLYFDTISGLLKVFMDRMIVKGDPHFSKTATGESRHWKKPGEKTPKLLMMSNCGFPERSHFQAISHWVQRVAQNMQTELLGEIYAAQGGLLSMELPQVKLYLQWVKNAGGEIASGQALSTETKQALEQSFLPDDIYIQNANQYFDSLLGNK